MIHSYTIALLMCSGGVRVFVDAVDPELVEREPAFVEAVFATLNDDRGWGRAGVSFCPADIADADIRVSLALPSSVDLLCAPIETNGQVSCALDGHAVINLERWDHATPAWSALQSYRHYVINHEVGHLLGMGHAKRCTSSGKAPLMMQQSRRRLRCEPNPWPTFHETNSVASSTEDR